MHIITMLLLLSILILVHELGHFSVAKLLKIKVERFGFGLPFGPTLFEKKIGDTIFCIHAFLLGGYVGFPDDNPESELPHDHPDRISNRPVWQRFLVIVAGVTANVIIAYLIVLMVAMLSGGIPSGKYKIYSAGNQPDKTFSAHNIGIQTNDKMVSANGVTIDSPVKFIEIAQRSKKFDNFVDEKNISTQLAKIKNNNPSLKLKENVPIPSNTLIKLAKADDESSITLPKDFYINPKASKPSGLELNSDQQKLRDNLENKNFYKADGKTSLHDLALATADNVHPISIIVERKGKLITLPNAYPNEKGVIGIKLRIEEIIIPTSGTLSSITGSWSYLYQNTYMMIEGLVKLFTGQVDFENLHGIVAITKVGSDIISNKGIWDGLLLTALISMDLAIVNLLPIPALDGGHIMFLLIEKIMGKPVEQETQEAFAKFGFIFLVGLMILIIFNDIFALVTDKL
jgi:regulator of sigma E protease